MAQEPTRDLVKWVKGQRGLWFTAYIAPWANFGLIVFYTFSAPDKDVVSTPAGFAAAAGWSLLMGLFFGVPTWYGISRLRLWGWYFVMGSMVLRLIGALYGIVMEPARFIGGLSGPLPGSVLGPVLGPVVWMWYLSTRKRLFHHKYRSRSTLSEQQGRPDTVDPRSSKGK